MTIKPEDVRRMLGEVLYRRAFEYYKGNRVRSMAVSGRENAIHIDASVRGTRIYNVDIDIDYNTGNVDPYCSCIAFDSYGRCKHIGAVLLEYINNSNKYGNEQPYQTTIPIVRNSSAADFLLTQFAPDDPKQYDRATIVPQLQLSGSRLETTFTIGAKRQYVIRDLKEFARQFNQHAVVTYGSQFTFKHDVSQLDGDSQRLLRLIRVCEKQGVFSSSYNARSMPLSGWIMDEFYDICRDREVDSRDARDKWHFYEGNPETTLRATSNENGLVTLKLVPNMFTVSGSRYDYAYFPHEIYRLTEDYAESLINFLDLSRQYSMEFSPSGAQNFCQSVLPRIRELVKLDGEAVLAPYLPSAMEVRYYLDLPQRGRMTAQAYFDYEGTTVQPDDPVALHPDIRRDGLRERNAVQALLSFFDPPEAPGGAYSLTDEDRMYAFLTDGVEKLSESGEVFFSDRLKNARVKKPAHMSVGVSVGESVLNLNLDTGEFPQEELESLMNAIREKRKFYRLRDGRFLDVNSSELGGFYEALDGLDLSASELAAGKAELPLSRALYLDNAFKQENDVSFQRDAAFRHLIRDFRTVEDSDFSVPEPLDRVLRGYQVTGYRWLRTLDAYRFGGILADDMGLGKTLQVLAYLLAVRRERNVENPNPRASLIVCPASLILNWGEEAKKWTPELSVCLLCGSAASREMEIQRREDYDIIVTSYDLLKRDVSLHKSANYYACILDEAQFIKNHETKGFKAVKEIRAMVRLALTGTPIENRLSELWSIFDFLMPGYLYKYAAFRHRFELPIAKKEDAKARETLRKLVSPFILRRMKKDVLSELPPKTETVHLVQMDEEQRKLYVAYAMDAKKKLAQSTDRDKIQIFAMMTRLRQLCCDPSLFVENYTGGSAKLDECARMLEALTESGHSVLVFSQFTSMLDLIRKRLDDMRIESFTLQGDTPRETRAELVRAFNAGEAPVFLISLKAGGTGLNLTYADTVIHYDPWWNIAAQNQATDRCYRIGQTQNVQVYQLICKGTIEENILKLQSSKRDLAETVVDASDGSLMSMSRDELMSLVDID